MERAIMCPQCNAPLTPHHFARSIVCSYCGATVRLDEASVSATTFQKALRTWNSTEAYQNLPLVSIGDRHWGLNQLVAHGETSDVYAAQRARWPTELVILKLLRDRQHLEQFDNEWSILQLLQKSNAPGADVFTALIPQPVFHGDVTDGAFAGRRVSVFRRSSGFYHNFDEVIRAYPQGIHPRASIWIWRRILEVLSFLHSAGMVHGAVVPAHLLVQENDHGVRLVGYGLAGRMGEALRTTSEAYRSFYPQSKPDHLNLTAQLDIVMSARSIVAILGGDPETVSLPAEVPAKLADMIQQIALSKDAATGENAWDIREALGRISNEVFGQPQFMPIVMPD